MPCRRAPLAVALGLVATLAPTAALAALDDEAAFLLRSATRVEVERLVCEGDTPPWSSAVASVRGRIGFEPARPMPARTWARIRALLIQRAVHERVGRAYAPGWPYGTKEPPIASLRLATPDGPVRLVVLLDEACAQILVGDAPRGLLSFPGSVDDLAALLGLRAPASRPSARVAPAPAPPPYEVPMSTAERRRAEDPGTSRPAAPAVTGPCPTDSGAPLLPDRLPEATIKVPPTYPDMAREANVDGTVMVEAFVDCDGRVAEARVVESIELLDEAALAAVRKWVFRPAVTNGRPVKTWTTIPVRFTLR